MSGGLHTFIDTHCHLDFSEFSIDFDRRLARWHAEGVRAFVVPAVSPENWEQVLRLSEQHSSIFPALGIHPYFLNQCGDDALASLERSLKRYHDRLVALGEIGLDARFDNLPEQQVIFEAQLELAKEYDLPVIVHAVKAHTQVYASLRTTRIAKGVIHAFSGSLQEAQNYTSLGFLLGVGSVICYSRAAKTRATIKSLPLDVLVLETDSPDMVLPGSIKGEGEPSDLVSIFSALCELREESPSELAKALNANAVAVFGHGFKDRLTGSSLF